MTCKGLTIDASISPHKSMIANLNEILSQTLPSRCLVGGWRALFGDIVLWGTSHSLSPKHSMKYQKLSSTLHQTPPGFPMFFWSPLSSFSGLYYPFQNKEWSNGFCQIHSNSERRKAQDGPYSNTKPREWVSLGRAVTPASFMRFKKKIFEILSTYALFFPPVF